MTNFTCSYVHCVSKKRPTFTTCYNFYIHSSIATIFCTNVVEKVGYQMYFIFLPHLTSAPALPGETGNPKIASFHLNAACFFIKKHETQLKYHLVRAEPPFTVKTIDRVHQTWPTGREHSILLCVTHILCVSQVCHAVSRCEKMGVVLRQAWSNSQWTVLMGYLTLNKC